MAKARVESLAAPDGKRPVSDWALRKLSARVATFLQVVGAHAPIRSALSKGGYSACTHAEGLRLLVAVCAYRSGGLLPDADLAPRAAASELFDWVRTHRERLNAALERAHPEFGPLFSASELADEASAVLVVSSALERLGVLVPDSPVLRTLTERGLDIALRERLNSLVQTACAAREPWAPTDGVNAASTPIAAGAKSTGSVVRAADAELLALHEWYVDWVATARTFIQRRDWLIRLGLLDRRRRPREASLAR